MFGRVAGSAVARVVVAALVGGAFLVPSAALAQGTTANPFNGQTNPLTPGLPQPSVSVPAAPTPTVVTTASTSGSSSGLSGGSAIAIAIGAILLLGGISFFIWRDARRRAPVRGRAAAATAGGASASGSKPRPKPRKLSPAERKRRKRGRAR
jgi:hypothetical protein